MRKLLIIAHNINSAGITSQTNNLINELSTRNDLSCRIILPNHSGFAATKNIKSKNFKITMLPYPRNRISKIFLRIFYDALLIPILIIKHNPKSVLAIANYLPSPIFFRKKIILIRHPYLLKTELSQRLPLSQKLKEKLTRLLLRVTLFTTDLVILQSEYMKDNFQKVYKNINTIVLPNPLSNAFLKKEAKVENKDLEVDDNSTYLFYPSRFYPHKNHIFINNLVKKYYKELEDLNVKIQITLGGEALNYFSGYEKELYDKLIEDYKNEPYNKTIINIGELSQTDLTKYYQNATAIFFPSSEETFGNGLIEGMFFKLPS